MKTSRSKIPTNQTILPGMEQAKCACGCGTYFMRVSRGRKRLYVNDTHKKRVARARRSARQSETTITLTPKGKLLAKTLAGMPFGDVWDNLDMDSQWTLHLASQHPSGSLAFWESVMKFIKRPNAWLDELRAALEVEYEDN